jgi:hypothetical protein
VGVSTALMWSDMKAPVRDVWWLLDASEEGGGMVRAAIPHKVARAVWRLQEQRGGSTQLKARARLYLEQKGLGHLLDPEGRNAAPWVEDLADGLEFEEFARWRWRKAGHINVFERRTIAKWVIALALMEGGGGEQQQQEQQLAASLASPSRR